MLCRSGPAFGECRDCRERRARGRHDPTVRRTTGWWRGRPWRSSSSQRSSAPPPGTSAGSIRRPGSGRAGRRRDRSCWSAPRCCNARPSSVMRPSWRSAASRRGWAKSSRRRWIPIITVDHAQRIVLFNAAAERVFQWPRKRGAGQRLDMLIPERFRADHAKHDRALRRRPDQTTRRMGEPAGALMALRANGEEFPIDASISQHRENGQEISTRSSCATSPSACAPQALLARSEARLRGILDSAMDAIITVDERQHIVLFNAAAEAMFGCPQAEAIDAPLTWFLPERFRRTHSEHVRRFGETGVSSRRMGALRVVTGPDPRRPRIPDRRVDLAALRRRRQVLHRHPARRHGARARRRGAAGVEAGAAAARVGGARGARAGAEPGRPRTARRARTGAHRAQDDGRLGRSHVPDARTSKWPASSTAWRRSSTTRCSPRGAFPRRCGR